MSRTTSLSSNTTLTPRPTFDSQRVDKDLSPKNFNATQAFAGTCSRSRASGLGLGLEAQISGFPQAQSH